LIGVVGGRAALTFGVKELAAQTVRTIEVLVVLLTELRLVVRWHVLLSLQFVPPMCKGALLIYYLMVSYAIFEFAEAEKLPIAAHLSLVLDDET